MLGTIVDYLHGALVSFRLASYPSEEAHPIAAHRISRGAMPVDTRPFFVGGRYDEFGRLEQPRLASFASAGQLSAGA